MITRRAFMSAVPGLSILTVSHGDAKRDELTIEGIEEWMKDIRVHHGHVRGYGWDEDAIYVELDNFLGVSDFEEDLKAVWGLDRVGEKVALIIHQDGYDVRFAGNAKGNKLSEQDGKIALAQTSITDASPSGIRRTKRERTKNGVNLNSERVS